MFLVCSLRQSTEQEFKRGEGASNRTKIKNLVHSLKKVIRTYKNVSSCKDSTECAQTTTQPKLFCPTIFKKWPVKADYCLTNSCLTNMKSSFRGLRLAVGVSSIKEKPSFALCRMMTYSIAGIFRG